MNYGYSGALIPEAEISGSLSVIPTIKGTIRAYDKADVYHGVYEVTPSSNDQELETRGKLLADNVLVNAIPYEEVTNPSGGTTVIIGG